MNNNPSSHSNPITCWGIVTSFLCCLRRKSPRIHLSQNFQNLQDLEAQPPNPLCKSEENHLPLEISLKNSKEADPNQDQPLSSPQFSLENNASQTISLPLFNPQKQAQNNPLGNLNRQSNIQEITQNDANLPINPLNSQQQPPSKICTIPLNNSHSLPKKTTSLHQSFIKKDSGLTDETAVPTNDPKFSLDNHPNHIQATQISLQHISILPNNLKLERKKVSRPLHLCSVPLKINLKEISVHSEDILYHTARSSQSQENMDDQPKTQDPDPKPEPQNDSHQIQEKENVRPSAEADILQRRPKQQDLVNISRVSNKSGLNHRGFNNPSANYCFAHALLQILYGLPEFRERTKRLVGQEKSNEILNKLCELFENIEDESKAQAEIERTKEELIERIKQKNQGITIFQRTGGDSRVLFQVLADNICEGQPFKQNPLFSLFSTGNLIKQVSCKNCPIGKPKKFIENSLMINAREDLFFSKESSKNFFQADSELRHCSICNERTPHSKEITLESLPKILALRIEDCSSDISPTTKPRKKLEFYDNRGKKKHYKFFGGVYNTKKGFDGVHSVAYIQATEHGTVKFYNDFMVRSVSWEDIHGYAKLLFYFEENP